MTRQQTVLLIDDDNDIITWITACLRQLEVRVLSASDGPTGLELASRHCPDLILLDLNLPGATGFDICSRLKEGSATQNIPIIFLTGNDDRVGKVTAFSLGAVDYVTKPFDVAELRARVRAVLRMQALMDELEHRAAHDHLTGLPNRESLHRALGRCVQASTVSAAPFAVLFLDLDRFKVINDSLGHATGDELLIAVATKLRECVRGGDAHDERDVVSRLGGDEFAILLHGVADEQAAIRCAERLRDELAKPVVVRGFRIAAGASIGIRMGQGATGSPDSLLRDADNAMYHAKAAGKDRYAVFDDRMHREAVRRLQLEHDLHNALDRGQFVLHYQPIYCTDSGRLAGFEALVRWQHPERGLIYPGEFIGIAEEIGLIMDLGRWVLRHACEQLRAWEAYFPNRSLPYVAVNVSKRQVMGTAFVEEVKACLTTSGLQPSLLQIELTESLIMHDVHTILPVLQGLRELGVSLAIDDFGTGYSSLSSLHQFPVNTVKIDRSFIGPMANDRVYGAIVDAVINLARNLRMTVVAEGVENDSQLVQLQALECDFLQGFLFSQAVPAAQAAELIRAGRISRPIPRLAQAS